MKRTSILVAVVAALASSASVARAYRTASDVPETSDTPIVRWDSSIVPLWVHVDGAPGLTFRATEDAVVAAALRWNAPTCTSLELRYRGGISNISSDDGLNTIVWHEYGWDAMGFDDEAAGVTDVVYERDEDGSWTIVDADIHLNGVDFAWIAEGGDANPDARIADVVLTHELGHLLGLLHPCELQGGGSPSCTGSSFADATMYPSYFGIEQATLASDDVAGLCHLYPATPCSPACGDASVCIDGQCVASCGGDVCTLAEECVAGACRLRCAGFECISNGDCQIDADCADDDACVRGSCIMAGGDLADPCTTGADCQSGLCVGDACSVPCAMSCPDGWECDPSSAACAATSSTFGGPCLRGDECASGVCVVTGARGTCSRFCGAYALPCPNGTECGPIGENSVCTSPRRASGCSVGTGDTSPLLLLLAVFAASVMRFRNRREVRNAS